MRTFIISFIVTFFAVLAFGLLAKADETQVWAVRPADAWTTQDNVQVHYWFTESGVVLTSTTPQLFIGPLLPGQDRPIVTSQFIGSGRTLCVNAEAYRSAEPAITVPATNNGQLCHRFPFGPLAPFTITTTP